MGTPLKKKSAFVGLCFCAYSRQLYALIRKIETKVFERFGVKLEREVKLIGEFEENWQK